MVRPVGLLALDHEPYRITPFEYDARFRPCQKDARTMTCLTAQYFLNHRLDPDEIRRHVDALATAGFQGIFAHGRQGLLTPFMSEAWWDAVDIIIAGCRRHGIGFWIWDDDYFPSGLAGGRVVWESPGLRSRALEFSLHRVQGGPAIEVDFPAGHLLRAFAVPGAVDGDLGPPLDVTPFCGTRRTTWTPRHRTHTAYSPQIDRIGPPHWRSSTRDNHFALMWDAPEPGPHVIVAALVTNGSEAHPDILRPEAIARFLKLIYEPYATRYPDDLGTLIKGAFTDEPSPGHSQFPWTPRFPEHFRADHGYDLLDHLAHLALDIDGRSPVVRHHYRQTQHRLQCTHYVQQVGDWCEAHGLVASGHLTRTEWLSLVAAWWPNELRCYKPLSIPCADPLGAASAWPDAAAYHTGLKVASSAAHLFGRARAGSDCLAVVGDEAALRDLKWILDYQMVLGINFFNIHGLSYSLDGPRKDEVPPSLFYQHTEWKHMGELLEHTRCTCEALTGGTHACGIAVLYPSTSLGCQSRPDIDWRNLPDEALIHDLVEQLLSHQRDFDFIDETTLQEHVTDAGHLSTPEPYHVLILPHLRFIESATARCLSRFAEAGGRVVVVGHRPSTIGSALAPARESESWARDPIEMVDRLDAALLRSLPGPEIEGEGARDVFVLRRHKDETNLTFLFNRAEREFSGRVDDRAVWVPPRGSALLENDEHSVHPLAGTELAADLSSDWTVRFEPNHVPLNFWLVATGPHEGERFDLLERQADPNGAGDDQVRYECRFMLTGDVPDARIVLEDSAIGGTWTLSVNDEPIEGFGPAEVFDCRTMQADVSRALRGGTTPTLNVVSVRTDGSGRGLFESPCFYGTFTCAFRHGHVSLPYLGAVNQERSLPALLPWDVLGCPTFSGTARYARTMHVAQAGDYHLDLGRVEDLAALTVDGQPRATLAWPPYVCALGFLDAGPHRLEIDITNCPANRNRVSGLPAGLLGPVRLMRP